MNFFADVISLMQLKPSSHGGAGFLYVVCSVAVATGATGSYTGNPFTALKNAIVNAADGERPTAFRGDPENALAAAEARWNATH